MAANGTVYTGCNVESASNGLAVSAERTAVLKAASDGNTDFLVGDGGGGEVGGGGGGGGETAPKDCVAVSLISFVGMPTGRF